jgi:hypothetical protein
MSSKVHVLKSCSLGWCFGEVVGPLGGLSTIIKLKKKGRKADRKEGREEGKKGGREGEREGGRKEGRIFL